MPKEKDKKPFWQQSRPKKKLTLPQKKPDNWKSNTRLLRKRLRECTKKLNKLKTTPTIQKRRLKINKIKLTMLQHKNNLLSNKTQMNKTKMPRMLMIRQIKLLKKLRMPKKIKKS